MNQVEPVVFDPCINPLQLNDAGDWINIGLDRPIRCTDGFGVRYRGRDVAKKMPFWRTHLYNQTSGEAFYYQNVLLYYPVTDLNALRDEHKSWRAVFFAVCNEYAFRMLPAQLAEIWRIDEVMQETGYSSMPQFELFTDMRRAEALEELSNMLETVSDEQKTVYEHLVSNAFEVGAFVIYGSAGTGKSYLLRLLYNVYVANNFNPVILAPTGIAAHTIGGQTLHRFFGIDVETGIINLIRLETFVKVYQHVVFLIDEVSMVSSNLVTRIDEALRVVLQNDYYFGGASVIFFGDMAQLPLVEENEGLFFQNPAITSSLNFQLMAQQRQDPAEPVFAEFLRCLRINAFSREVVEFIMARHHEEQMIPLKAIRLFPTNRETDQYNQDRSLRMPGVATRYTASDAGPTLTLNETRLAYELDLKVDMLCMLLHNIDVENGWTNGTMCVITAMLPNEVIVARTTDGVCKAIVRITRELYQSAYSRSQFPLAPAFASTVHKTQSLAMDNGVAISLLRPLESFGQLYVACSRVKTARDLYFFGLGGTLQHPSVEVGVNHTITAFLNSLANLSG